MIQHYTNYISVQVITLIYFYPDPLTRYDSRPSMKDLNNRVMPLVAAKWYELGLELLETKHERELEIIEREHSSDRTKCCRKMFSKWLDSQSDC